MDKPKLVPTVLYRHIWFGDVSSYRLHYLILWCESIHMSTFILWVVSCNWLQPVGTIWRTLSKPHQRRQGPDPRPLWLLVGTPSAFGPELAYRLRVAQPNLIDVTRYIWYTIFLYIVCVFLQQPLAEHCHVTRNCQTIFTGNEHFL